METLLKSTQKITLPKTDLVGVKKSKTVTKESTKLPQPTGWRILVMPFRVKEETQGGIFIAQDTLDRARAAAQVGYVLKMGPLCYEDKEKYKKEDGSYYTKKLDTDNPETFDSYADGMLHIRNSLQEELNG